jgi:hypothetical protein
MEQAMKRHTSTDQAQQRAEALQQEAVRLAGQAKDQLADYARTLDGAKQTRKARAAIRDSQQHIQHAASQASDQAAAAIAAALEHAAGTLRTYAGESPAAQLARSMADSLERGSEYLQPWSARAVLRRAARAARHYTVPALLVALSAAGAAYLLSRRRHMAS